MGNRGWDKGEWKMGKKIRDSLRKMSKQRNEDIKYEHNITASSENEKAQETDAMQCEVRKFFPFLLLFLSHFLQI